MKKIVLVSCASKKRNHRAKARDLYTSPLFVGNLRFAESLKPDSIFILSAKYGLLELDAEIEPYDLTLNHMSPALLRAWAGRVTDQLRRKADLLHDHFVFLAGDKYRKHLL
ncbi:MAG TPA: hypothetical protein VLL49_01230, partial [Anaerolineales bacterium]|nr:hypothetical protein [Anaerolineales bacterium]